MVARCQAAALTIDPVISHLASAAYACTGSVVWSCLNPRGYEPGPQNRPDHANLVKFSIFLTCIQSHPIVPLHHWVHMGQHISWKLVICFTQVTPEQGNRADVTNDSDGAGSRATAGCTRRKNSVPRLRERRRLNRKVNSSR